MLTRLFAGGLLAGAAAGLVAAALQQALLVPLILEAEAFEGHAHGAGIARGVLTTLFSVLTMCGFGLALVAGFAAAERAGMERITPATGAAWGLAGFAAFMLLPGLGLPPEPPGVASAGVGARQAWWLFASVGSAAGLAALAYGRGAWRLAGLALIAAPHLVGAPAPEDWGGTTPPGLAALFASRALGVGAVVWLTLGLTAGWIWSRGARE